MALFWYFKRKGNSEKLPIDCIFQFISLFCYWFKQQKKEGPVWKVHSWTEGYDWKKSCWTWSCSQLVHPRPLYTDGNLVSQLSVRNYNRGHSSTCARGVWFTPDPTTFFTTNHYKSEHPRKFYPPPPPEKYPLYSIRNHSFAVCIFTYHQLTKIQMLIYEITHGDSCNKYSAINAITFTENYGELHAANECSRSIYNLLTLSQLLFFFCFRWWLETLAVYILWTENQI